MKKEKQGKIGQTHSFISSAKASYTEPDTALSRQLRLKTTEHILHKIIWVNRTNGNILLNTNNTIYCRPYKYNAIWKHITPDMATVFCELFCNPFASKRRWLVFMLTLVSSIHSESCVCNVHILYWIIMKDEVFLLKLCTVSQLFLQMLM